MISYEINCDTLALLPVSGTETKVVEKENMYLINKPVMEIIENSCEFFGSTYDGRHQATKNLIGVTHKSPIIIEESRNIIYFPTCSPRLENCCWIGLNNIKKYENKNGSTELLFSNNKKIKLPISYGSFDNQYLRATKLESVLRKRINATE